MITHATDITRSHPFGKSLLKPFESNREPHQRQQADQNSSVLARTKSASEKSRSPCSSSCIRQNSSEPSTQHIFRSNDVSAVSTDPQDEAGRSHRFTGMVHVDIMLSAFFIQDLSIKAMEPHQRTAIHIFSTHLT